jgi:tetratricopeptide (TPR) repeat protein
MMNKENLPHIITVVSFTVFIALGLACASTKPTQRRLDGTDDYMKRAFSHYENKKYDLAVEDCNQVIWINSNDWRAYALRGLIYDIKKDYDLAIKDFTEAIRSNPNSPLSYNGRAWIYAYHLKTNFDQAIADATQAIRLDSNKAEYYDTRGWAYLGKGDYNKAIDDFNRALRIDSSMESSKEGLRKIREAQAEEVIDWSQFE